MNLLKLFTSYKKSLFATFSNQTLAFRHVVALLFVVYVLSSSPLWLAGAEIVHIPDPHLRAAVAFALDKEAGADITQADMASLEVLQASKCRFLKQSGVPRWLPLPRRCPDDVFGSDIQDLSGLEFAINLKELHLAHNKISDVSPLKSLKKLIVLDLHNNFRISDASALSTLTNLTHLSLWGNLVSDASPLRPLTNLIYLSLENNEVSDVSPLKDMTNLIGLDIEANQISDLSPLKDMTKLIFLDFDSNEVSDVSLLKDMTMLTQLDGSDNHISDLSPLSALTRMIQMDLDDNKISDISPLKDMIELSWLDLDGNQIVDISPLQNMIKLTRLNLDDNKILDVSPLKNMTKLEKLDLDHNEISNVSALRDMIKLTWLDLDDNEISDISPLKNMTRLMLLDLGDNQISDISPLKNMIELTDLDLNDNEISDISPLSAFIGLMILDLDGNEISNVSPLSTLINLTELDLHDNEIVDISPLKNMTKLKVLDLSENHITDFSPIAKLVENLMEYDNSAQTAPPIKAADVNRDGVVNITDLVLVAFNFQNPDFAVSAQFGVYPDVNGDKVVDVRDLVAVAAEIDAAAAPALIGYLSKPSVLTVENLSEWVSLAKGLDTQEPWMQKGITVLEQILASLTFTAGLPRETALLANYPNPFNPETWIPYQLAVPAEVSISIHSAEGQLVQTLKLGELSAGIYHSKSKAAYWDGRNESGESVASGVYFYTLTAGDFTVTRKMLVQK